MHAIEDHVKSTTDNGIQFELEQKQNVNWKAQGVNLGGWGRKASFLPGNQASLHAHKGDGGYPGGHLVMI